MGPILQVTDGELTSKLLYGKGSYRIHRVWIQKILIYRTIRSNSFASICSSREAYQNIITTKQEIFGIQLFRTYLLSSVLLPAKVPLVLEITCQ